MKVEWDYTDLANAYLKRPDYSEEAINKMLELSNVNIGDCICDVGAGAAHLTLMLAKSNLDLNIFAVEPNDAMRNNGIIKTKDYKNVQWFEGTGEETRMESNKFDLVTFGSSFNVCDRQKALNETSRILKEKGWFACMWNHRNLDDTLQQSIENIIKKYIPEYSYGTRREDQTDVINESNLFSEVHKIEGIVNHKILAADFIEGWKSHGTVYRQSPKIFDSIVNDIKELVLTKNHEYIEVPYTTRIWLAQSKTF